MRVHAAALAAGLLAAAAGAEEVRQLGAHEHGRGVLDIALEGDRIVMAFKAPGADIVGFEHAPRDGAQTARIEAALAALERPLDLFVLPEAAGCTVADATARLLAEGDDHEHGADEGGADAHHGHAADDDATHHHGGAAAEPERHDHHEDHEDHATHEDSARHSEFRADYALECEAPADIDAIGFGYFDQFPNAEALSATVIDDAGARRFDVTRSEPVLDLRVTRGG